MPSGPPKALEAIVGWCIPPACREEVLGDLHEKYTGPGQYIALAMRVVPFVIVSRIRRTTDPPVLLMQALLIYASYLAGGWYTDRSFLFGQWGLLRMAIPMAPTLFFMMWTDAWCPFVKSPLKLIGRVAWACVFAFLLLSRFACGRSTMCLARTLPDSLNLFGACASLLLVSAVRILFRPGADMPQSATGPALELKERAGPAVLSDITKGLLAAVPVTVVAIALVSIGFRPGAVGAFIFVVVLMIGLQLSKSRKE